MSVVSGVISRQVLPACGNLCFFCPSLRARSRQPVKRYKKLIAEIFPRGQEEEPNDRKIGKLCEYAAKNPLRIPKITTSLEQRCYKELRNENFRAAKIVMCIYRKLLVTCKDQMPLFAKSLLSIIQTLLDQTRQDELLIIGCKTLFDFINNQKDGTYMLNIEGFIPKLCQMSQEVGDDDRAKQLRSAGLEPLSAMVWLMGQNSHISVEFDNIVSIVLENFEVPGKESQDPNGSRWLQEVRKNEVHASTANEALIKVPSWHIIVNDKGEPNVSIEDAQNPCFWSRVCLHNMAKIGKEATTMRRVLESLFRNFDNGNLWPSDHGIALPVLREMQLIMDESGQNAHFLLSILIKHLDQRSVLKQPDMQLDIVEVATSLARDTKVEASVAIIGAVTDVMRHLRKSIHHSLDDSNLGADIIQWNKKIREAVDKCLVELSCKVGDSGPILDAMAAMLENISNITVIARTTTASVYRTAQIVTSLPNISYQNMVFPEYLFHQLLPAMVHPDHETRVGAHRIFSVVLVPSSVRPYTGGSTVPESMKASDLQRTLSRTVSVFSSSAALFEKLKNQKPHDTISVEKRVKFIGLPEQQNSNSGMLDKIRSSYSRVYSSKPATDIESTKNVNKEADALSFRLSSHQINLLLSSIWIQAISPENMPENYEAISHTFSLVLLFSRAKNSSREVLVQSFQLVFSLRSLSLTQGGVLPPSRRRSLFVLASSMIIFTSKAYEIPPLVSTVKAALTEKTIDPFLSLVGDSKLQAVNTPLRQGSFQYGSEEDDNSAIKSLSEIEITDDQTREHMVSLILKSSENLINSQISNVKEQLLDDFLPDDACPTGSHLFPDASDTSGPLLSIDDDTLHDSSENGAMKNSKRSDLTPDLLSANQLLESVSETAHEVGRISISTASDVSYKEMTNHCEALLMGKQQKMSHLMNLQQRQESSLPRVSSNFDKKTDYNLQINQNFEMAGNPFTDQKQVSPIPTLCAAEYNQNPLSFRLPASSPYDNFLKAAGC